MRRILTGTILVACLALLTGCSGEPPVSGDDSMAKTLAEANKTAPTTGTPAGDTRGHSAKAPEKTDEPKSEGK